MSESIDVSSRTVYGDIEVSTEAGESTVAMYQGPDSILLEYDAIPDLMVALADLHMAWKRHNSPLYRDPSTLTAGES